MAGGSRREQKSLSAGHIEFQSAHRAYADWPARSAPPDPHLHLHSSCRCAGVEPAVAKLPDWVVVQEVAHPLQPSTVSGSIGPGEREVISLGLELRAALLILDEQPARRLATSLGLRVIGTVGLLMAGKERGFLAKIRPELNRLLAVRFFMAQDLYDRVIAQAGE
jgi:predicted nucleic acid-binding protein